MMPQSSVVAGDDCGGGGESGSQQPGRSDEPEAKTRQETVRPENVASVAKVTAHGHDDAC